MDESKRAIIEQRVMLRVQREIAETNERLVRLHGIDPNNEGYKAKKYLIRYAVDHHITVGEARWIVAEKRRKGQL